MRMSCMYCGRRSSHEAAREIPGADEHLRAGPCQSFPRFGALIEVATEGLKRNRERSLAAFWAKTRVDSIRDALAGRISEKALRVLDKGLPAGGGIGGVGLVFVDEDQIQVGMHSQLGPAQLPERDNRPRRAGLIEGGRRMPARNLRDAVIGQ
jgi:hypothetical protein